MISEMYRNGPKRCLKPIQDRQPTPLAATSKPVCLNNNPSRPEHNKPRQRNDRRQTIDDWRQRSTASEHSFSVGKISKSFLSFSDNTDDTSIWSRYVSIS